MTKTCKIIVFPSFTSTDGPTRYTHQRTFRTEEQFYVLFNPFMDSDLVYLSHPAGREEFVMTDVGKVNENDEKTCFQLN